MSEPCACGATGNTQETWDHNARHGVNLGHWPKRLGGCGFAPSRALYPPPAPAAPAGKSETVPHPDPANAECGLRYNAGKPVLHLVSRAALIGTARVLEWGARKYAAHNWRKGMDWTTPVDSMLRHLFAWLEGEDRDICPEHAGARPDDCTKCSGLPHVDHIACNAMFLQEYVHRNIGTDDRWKAPAAPGPGR